MATFLDIGILSNFSIVFVFLLVFTVMYALLEYINPFGKERKGVHGLIALAVAILIVVSKPAVLVINFATPWFLVMFLFLFFILFAVRMFGASEADAIGMIKSPQVYTWVIVFAVLIILGSFAFTFGQTLLTRGEDMDFDNSAVDPVDLDNIPDITEVGDGSTRTGLFGINLLNTIIHPKVLGMIAIMLVGVFTLVFMTKVS